MKQFDKVKISIIPTEELVSLVEYHNRKYWEEGSPEIPDEDYDLLIRELSDREPNHPLLEKIYSPKVASIGKVKHEKPMLSLEKVYSHGELINWAAKFARSENELFKVQPKYDGISAYYRNGVLATRGDGFEGEDISDKVPLIEVETTGYRGALRPDMIVRGEIVIRDDDFKQIYSRVVKKDGTLYKNQRNAVAGIVGLKDIKDMQRQGAKLTLIDYELHSEVLNFRELSDEHRWNEVVVRFSALPYPMDGLVVKLADEEYSESLGATAHHPRGQVAFKFSGQRCTSKILDIQWSFGKNCLTPIAVIEPVEIGGITIRNVTLHNYKFVLDNDIKIGDEVVVERAGDVIPHVVSVYPGNERRSALIEACPSCATKLIVDGPELRCPNKECPELNLQRLLAAVKSIGIERLGEPTLRKIVSKLGVRTLKDIFMLSKEKIISIEGFKDKSAENLYNEIQKARTTTDYAFLSSLNIEGIGKNIAKKILEQHSLDELRNMSPEELEKIPGIGPERSRELYSRLREEKDTIEELLGAINLKETKSGGAKKSPTVCFTGKMPMQRSYYEKLAREHGMEPVDAVTQDLSVLVVADLNERSSKREKAEKYGVRIVLLEDWLKEIEKGKNNIKSYESDKLPGFE